MEPEDEDQLEFTDEEVKAKRKIMFCNNVFALSTVLAKMLMLLRKTLYSLDQTFFRGVCRDVESFFNCIVMMLQDYQNSAQLHMDITLHIAEEARSCYLVSFYDFV